MAAAMSPAARIIAVDRVAERLELARELGATDTIEAGTGSLAEESSPAEPARTVLSKPPGAPRCCGRELMPSRPGALW